MIKKQKNKLMPTRAKIIAMAKKTFAKNGYELASMHLIADQVGINKSSLYYFFKNKEDLFATVTLDVWQKLSDSAISNMKRDNGKNGRQICSRICQDFISISLTAGISAIRMEMPKNSHPFFKQVLKMIYETHEQSLKFLKRYNVKDPRIAQTIIFNNLHSYVIGAYMGKPQPPVKQYCDYLASLLIKPINN
ncbi:MAG: TetR/AcrR family transcriptional regulator [Patescibacteria group bacterium]